ncbi:MAG: hypothetical protein L0271_04185 [Gemmatimonadetes bacterium]|nr:hypothetical protein [Gemmatimonadota bacterium]
MRTRIEPAADGTSLDRRTVLGRALGAAATLIVSQSVLSCSTDAAGIEADDDDGDGEGNGSTGASCVLTAALTEGPYFVDERLNRSDIRTDPVTGEVSQGVPLELTFNVSRVDGAACTALTGAYLDVWHCDAAGVYSDVQGAGTGHRFLRGYQITDGQGVARFTTIYPGWYTGRAVHIHFKLRLIAGSTTTYEFTSQFFFNESLTDVIHALSPYSSKGRRDRLNTTDGIYNSLSAAEKAALTLQATPGGSGYAGVISLGVRVG